MIRLTLSLCLLLTMIIVAIAQQPSPPKTTLKVGDPAPDFILPSTAGDKVKPSDEKSRSSLPINNLAHPDEFSVTPNYAIKS